MKKAIVIPARFQSTRFPGKPLVDLLGKSMIQRVYEICSEVIGKENVYVATDDERIEKHCLDKKLNVVMTSSSCLTGTDRVYEASLKIDADIFINVQGDEPLIKKSDIQAIISQADKSPEAIINGMGKIKSEKIFFSTTVPKVVFGPSNKLLYMSRAGIPATKELKFEWGYRQVCIYSFPSKALKDFYEYGKKTPLEQVEDIEILRFIELGYEVEMVEVSSDSVAIDTEEDRDRVIEILKGIEND
ncbi:3-deoxy-manno-octulosonate cytidylyltransferase [Bacteriovoracaceae bacterium]|nr:3-deoxy-manno-octulosonate cytidylyltransferase [Bacteriovoracaceae bacterium]